MLPVFLIGYMASGKTTLGRALERLHGVKFVDLDHFIEQQAGMSVSEIFAREGEASFRRREQEGLQRLAEMAEASKTPVVIACGGGTPCFADNMERMNACGLTVWLQVSPERHMERLRLGRASRPLIAALDDEQLAAFAARQLSLRRPFYERAAHTFDSSLLETPEEIALTAHTFFTTFLPPT